jgi:formate-dependent nitrite reductase cytochrome c552 subunit
LKILQWNGLRNRINFHPDVDIVFLSLETFFLEKLLPQLCHPEYYPYLDMELLSLQVSKIKVEFWVDQYHDVHDLQDNYYDQIDGSSIICKTSQ